MCVCVDLICYKENNCDMIYEKESLLKHLKRQFCILRCSSMNSCAYIAAVCIQNCFCDVLTVVFFHEPCHNCFARSSLFS